MHFLFNDEHLLLNASTIFINGSLIIIWYSRSSLIKKKYETGHMTFCLLHTWRMLWSIYYTLFTKKKNVGINLKQGIKHMKYFNRSQRMTVYALQSKTIPRITWLVSTFSNWFLKKILTANNMAIENSFGIHSYISFFKKFIGIIWHTNKMINGLNQIKCKTTKIKSQQNCGT